MARAARAAAPVLPPPEPERTQTTVRIEVSTLIALKKLAADRRCAVNDLVLEAIDALLDRAGR